MRLEDILHASTRYIHLVLPNCFAAIPRNRLNTMRLMDTSTYSLEEFNRGDVPLYAILSHVWEDEEVTFRDMTEKTDNLVSARSKRGYSELATTCKIAAAEGFSYAWIDTCCIDKSSSAELSESINSMFRWYRRATKCYVYLADLVPPAHVSGAFEDGLWKCRWFTHGFTLQELVAPSQIDFFDQEWKLRTTKRDSVQLLSDITGIDVEILRHQKPLSSIPVAQRMSWAADRQTTRVEDLAYCLFGIFDVNIPLLYGEEEKAFLRLQEEILKNTMDLTILAWTMPKCVANSADTCETSQEATYSGVFAQSDSYFHGSGSLASLAMQMLKELHESNRSLKLDAGVIFEPLSGKQGHACILPICLDSRGKNALGIFLKHCAPGLLSRQRPHELAIVDMSLWRTQTWRHEQRLLLRQLPETGIGLAPPPTCARDFRLDRRKHIPRVLLPAGITIDANLCWPAAMWDSEEQFIFLNEDADPDHGAAAVFMIQGSVAVPVNRRGKSENHTMDFHCIAYAIGWGRQQPLDTQGNEPTATKIQFTLLDPSVCGLATNLRSLHRRFDLLDFRNCAQLKADLIHYNIPQQSEIVYVLNDLGASVIVQGAAIWTPEDVNLCRRPFWRLDISWKVVPSNETPLKLHVKGQRRWS